MKITSQSEIQGAYEFRKRFIERFRIYKSRLEGLDDVPPDILWHLDIALRDAAGDTLEEMDTELSVVFDEMEKETEEVKRDKIWKDIRSLTKPQKEII